MKTNTVIGIPPPILYLSKFCFSSYWPKCCQPIKMQGPLKCTILRKKLMMKFIFGIVDKHQSFLPFGYAQPDMPKVLKIRSLISLQYLQKNMWDKFNLPMKPGRMNMVQSHVRVPVKP